MLTFLPFSQQQTYQKQALYNVDGYTILHLSRKRMTRKDIFQNASWLSTKENGQVLKPELTKTRSAKEIQTVLINLCKEFDNLGHCPLQISVPDLATESVLKAFCKALKIKLVKERRPLRELNEAWDYLHNYSMDI